MVEQGGRHVQPHGRLDNVSMIVRNTILDRLKQQFVYSPTEPAIGTVGPSEDP